MTAGAWAVDARRLGFLSWEWEARGVIVRPMVGPSLVTLPTGHSSLIAQGRSLTKRGAFRKGERIARYYCQ